MAICQPVMSFWKFGKNSFNSRSRHSAFELKIRVEISTRPTNGKDLALQFPNEKKDLLLLIRLIRAEKLRFIQIFGAQTSTVNFDFRLDRWTPRS